MRTLKFFGKEFKRDIHRVQLSHALRSVALSLVSVYVPIFLLTHGFSFSRMILFFITFHFIGLLFALFVCPAIINRVGFMGTIRISYPLQIVFFILMNILALSPGWWPFVAALGGVATFIYWLPLNILFLKYADEKKMGSDVSVLFALPQMFGIAGPLLGAIFVPFVGFWPMFIVSGIGLVVSYLPLIGIEQEKKPIVFRISQAWEKLRGRRILFVLEGLENVIEESEWFWGIFVFLIIGSLSTPGIVGSLEAIGGVLFTVLIGKRADKGVGKLLPFASLLLITVWFARFYISGPVFVYGISIIASFVMMLFMVSYYSLIYRKVKNDDEEAFMILREIPVVLGRMVVFGSILLVASDVRKLFILPIVTVVLLLILFLIKRKKLGSGE